MCENCGCGVANATHSHTHDHHHHGDHSHDHDHDHDHDHAHDAAGRTIMLEQKILSRNDEIADKNRAWLEERGVVAINIISSPRSGSWIRISP